MNTTDNCPVCGYELGFHPWEDDFPSDEICPSCGIQFGYDDLAGGDLSKRKEVYIQWRHFWEINGKKWFSANPKPKDWNP